jgi:hypothetical protein
MNLIEEEFDFEDYFKDRDKMYKEDAKWVRSLRKQIKKRCLRRQSTNFSNELPV